MASDSLLQFDDRRAYTLVRQFRFLVIHHNMRALLCGIKEEMVELAMRMPSPLAPALEKSASLWRGCLQLQRRHKGDETTVGTSRFYCSTIRVSFPPIGIGQVHHRYSVWRANRSVNQTDMKTRYQKFVDFSIVFLGLESTKTLGVCLLLARLRNPF